MGLLVTPFHQQEGRAGTRTLGCSSTSGDLLARIHLGILVWQNCPSVNAVFGGGGEMGLQCESVSEFPKPAVELPAIHQCLIPPSSQSVTSPKGDCWVEVGLGHSSPLQI